ncbi:MAG: 16S rRNA (cytosine(1402)-N(4))-methyltransferase RsmH [Myxococcota bacterium]
MVHIPVLARETLELLAPRSDAVVVDVTAGGGGHLSLLAEAIGPGGRVLALDRDPRAHEESAAGGVQRRFADRVNLIRAPFSALASVLRERGIPAVDVILADIGVSSMQLDERARGFSFREDGPLDMRMDPDAGETAWELLARLDENEIADVLYQYGDEHRSRRIARAIKKAWPLPDSTAALAALIARACGSPHGRIHAATKSFQAIRIAVNGELDELDQLLRDAPHCLALGGRLGIISFHSLEDRRVKHAFQALSRRNEDGAPPHFHCITRRPVSATAEEMATNPRARSAKLRVLERVSL